MVIYNQVGMKQCSTLNLYDGVSLLPSFPRQENWSHRNERNCPNHISSKWCVETTKPGSLTPYTFILGTVKMAHEGKALAAQT